MTMTRTALAYLLTVAACGGPWRGGSPQEPSHVVEQLPYRNDRSGSQDRTKIEFLDEVDESGDDVRVIGGDAERQEILRSKAGLDIEKRFTLRDGKPAQNQYGISIQRLDYDERGHQVKESYFDEADKPVRNTSGIAGWRATVDARSNQTERTFLDVVGKPIRNKNGVAGWRATFDARGNPTETAFFDDVGKSIRNKNGVAGWRSTFDERSNEIARAFFDELGRRVKLAAP